MTKTTALAMPRVMRRVLNALTRRGESVRHDNMKAAWEKFQERALLASVPAAASPIDKPMNLRAVLAGGALLIASGVAGAFTAPAAGDFGYDVYDIVVNQILNGPIGFIGGVALIVFGATQIMKNWFATILCIIAGTVLIRADSLVVTLGKLVG